MDSPLFDNVSDSISTTFWGVFYIDYQKMRFLVINFLKSFLNLEVRFYPEVRNNFYVFTAPSSHLKQGSSFWVISQSFGKTSESQILECEILTISSELVCISFSDILRTLFSGNQKLYQTASKAMNFELHQLL